MNPLTELHRYGQSFWYDNIQRSLLRDGTITSLINEDGLRGMTSNPSIFAKAIGTTADYDDDIRDLAAAGHGIEAVYERLALADIAAACELFDGIYRDSDGKDGYVSLEVSPHLAHDEENTVAEAIRLFEAVDRPNVMIKVPATEAGIRAFERLIAKGINVNVTLMFSMQHYEAIAKAYISGIRSYVAAGGDPARVASVASFFVSRVDTAVDSELDEMEDGRATALHGKSAVANSKVVYQRYKQLFGSDKFAVLQANGARVQRLLWASTSTKNPAYRDTLYVDELIGPETVNTMPPQTIDAFRDHGRPEATLEKDLEEARRVLRDVGELGINLDQITEQLQRDGIKAFSDSYDELLQTLDEKIATLRRTA